jgi:apolipoprotein N-acyltransferase
LYPFETSYFEKFYEEEQEILRIIYRLNMPNELVVPPGETVIKYVSIPSLNPTTKGLDVKLIQDDITQSFKFSVNIEEQSQTTLLEEITFKAEDEWKLQVQRYYFVIVTPDNRIHIIKDNSLFLPQEIKSKKLNIYGIASLSTGYTFAKKENFSLNQYQSSEVELEFEEEQKYRK